MKKVFLIIFALILCMILTACDSENIIESGSVLGSGLGHSSDNEEFSDPNQLAKGVHIAYDRTKYENVTAPKCYYAELGKIEEQTLLDLFSSEPEYTERADGMKWYTTNTETGYLNKGSLTRRNGHADTYHLSFWTQAGNDYDSADSYWIPSSGCNFENYSTTKEFDFMTYDELKADFLDKTKGIFSTELEFYIFPIDAESYLKEVEFLDAVTKLKPEEKVWSEAADHYYVKVLQTVDGIPISPFLSGSLEQGTSAEGCDLAAVYTENGLEYLVLETPWRILGEAPTENTFLSLQDAEEIIRSKNNTLDLYSISMRKDVTIKNIRLAYMPVVKSEGTILTPFWEFCSDFWGTEYALYSINAYTGEMLR